MALPAEFFYLSRSRTTGEITIYKTPSTPVVTSADLAAQGITLTTRRPCIIRFKGEVFITGCFSRPLYYPVRDPLWVPVGIRPHDQTLTVAATGSGSLVGQALCYITYQHRVGDVVLAESNPSNYVPVNLAGAAARQWGGLTSATRERRVTHVAGYVSLNGAGFRRAFVMPYGATTYTEGTAEAALTIEGPYKNYLPPMGAAFSCVFANRVWYANTSEYPWRIWFSEAGEGQYVDLASFRDTLDRDAISGIAPCQGVLIVFTLEKAYAIRFNGTTFTIDRIDSSFGCICHFGCVEIHNKLWFPSQDGIAIYEGGGFRFVMKDMRPYWQADYLEHQQEFMNGFAVNNKTAKNYVFIIPREKRDEFEDWEPGHVAYIGNYLNFEPSMGGVNEQPDWSIDLAHRIQYAAFYGLDNRLYFGGEDGAVRVEDDLDGDDDGDTIQKELRIDHGLLLFQEPGDDVESGKKLEQLWVYTESELTDWRFAAMMGDEWAELQFEPDNIKNAALFHRDATALTQVIPDPDGSGEMLADYIPETVHHLGVEGIAGRGITARVRAIAPVGLKYRGFGGMWGPGAGPRKARHITTFSVAAIATNDPTPPSVALGGSTPTERIAIAGGEEFTFKTTLTNDDLVPALPVSVTYDFTGGNTISVTDDIVTGLVSPGYLDPGLNSGPTTLTVTVVLGAETIVKTYYLQVS